MKTILMLLALAMLAAGCGDPARANYPIIYNTMPDVYGVICYYINGNDASLSCVKVQ